MQVSPAEAFVHIVNKGLAVLLFKSVFAFFDGLFLFVVFPFQVVLVINHNLSLSVLTRNQPTTLILKNVQITINNAILDKVAIYMVNDKTRFAVHLYRIRAITTNIQINSITIMRRQSSNNSILVVLNSDICVAL